MTVRKTWRRQRSVTPRALGTARRWTPTARFSAAKTRLGWTAERTRRFRPLCSHAERFTLAGHTTGRMSACAPKQWLRILLRMERFADSARRKRFLRWNATWTGLRRPLGPHPSRFAKEIS